MERESSVNNFKILSTFWFLISTSGFFYAISLSETTLELSIKLAIFLAFIYVNLKHGFWIFKGNIVPYSFHILEYDFWDEDKNQYIRVFNVYKACEYKRYFLFYNLGDYYDSLDVEKLKPYLKYQAKQGIYHRNKEEAMKEILEVVNHYITLSKEKNKEIILNLKENDVILFKDLINK